MKIEKLFELIRENKIKEGTIIKVQIAGISYDYYWDSIDLYRYDNTIGERMRIRDMIEADFKIADLVLVGTDFERRLIDYNFEKNDVDTLEIIDGNRITIGFWVLDKMGYNFRFVGDRFQNVDKEELYALIQKGQDFLNKKYRGEDYV